MLFYINLLMWERSPSLIKLHRGESPAAADDDQPRLVVPSSTSSSSSSVRLSASWFCAFHLFIFKRQIIAHTACCENLKPPEVVVSIGEIVCRLNLSWSRIVCSLWFLLLALLCLLLWFFRAACSSSCPVFCHWNPKCKNVNTPLNTEVEL